MNRIEMAGRTDVGRVRRRNEDAHVLLPRHGVVAVADGMGGLQDGDVASRTAIAVIEEAAAGLSAITVRAPHAVPSAVRQHMAQAMELLTHVASYRVRQAGEDRPTGTTLVTAALCGDRLLVCNVGDSRAYLLRDGRLRPLTQDHTVAAARYRAGTISEDELAKSPEQHVLYQALGSAGDLDADLVDVRLARGDVVVLCTDGLTGVVDDGAITQTLLAFPDLHRAAEALVAEANAAGGPDNVTVALLRLVDGEEPDKVDREAAAWTDSPVLRPLSPMDRLTLALYLDEGPMPTGQQVVDRALHVVLSGGGVEQTEPPVHLGPGDAFGLLSLAGPGAPRGTVDLEPGTRVTRLTPDALAALEPRRPQLTARLLRGILGEVARRGA